jgi:hypothetical protein
MRYVKNTINDQSKRPRFQLKTLFNLRRCGKVLKIRVKEVYLSDWKTTQERQRKTHAIY